MVRDELKDRKTFAEVSADTLALEQYLRTLTPGTLATYAELTQHTGVTMDTSGKAKLRTALRRARLVHTPIKGVGIQLSDESNGVPILTDHLAGVDRKVRKAEKVASLIYESHGAKMSPVDREMTVSTIAMFGTVRAIAEARKRELRRAKEREPQLAPPTELRLV